MAHFVIQDLTFSYPNRERPALDHLDLTIEQGAYVVLCGASGSGKTTLLRHLKSVLTPHGRRSGQILFNGTPLEQIPLGDQASRIGFVMQNPDDQIVTDKVWHELAFGLESLGTEPELMRLRVAEMASYFGIQDWFHRDVATLSGGQKQLLNLASIMAMQPQVLILDEPTSQLDPIAASDFLNTVKKINMELGTTVIITEHRLEDVFHSADQVIVMEQGRIVAQGSPRAVSKALWQAQSPMFAALPAPTRIFYQAGAKGESPLTVREGRAWLSKALPKVTYTTLEETPAPLASEMALRLKDIWFRYEKDGEDVLRGVNLEVPKNSIFALLGGNGTGKSTTLKAIAGICRPYRGKVELFDQKMGKGQSAFRQGLAMLPQDPKSLFVKKTLALDLEEMTQEAEKIQKVAQLCRIEHLLEQHPMDLSGGELQRSALAKVLLTEPKLLLLDEPTKGLDSFFKLEFAKILEKLTQKGVTILMVSHDVEFCAEYAHQVGMFFDGQMLTQASPKRFFGQNSFYTTAANRMSRCVFRDAVTAQQVVELYEKNGGERL